MLDLHFSGTADEVLADLKRIMPALLAGTPLPPMQEQPSREPASAEPPKERKPRSKKAEAAEGDKGEQTASVDSQASAAPASIASQTTSDTASGSTESLSRGGETKAEIPDIEELRAALKKLGATDGFGHDKVFEVLGQYNVKTASTLPEDKRAEVIAKINDMLAPHRPVLAGAEAGK